MKAQVAIQLWRREREREEKEEREMIKMGRKGKEREEMGTRMKGGEERKKAMIVWLRD